MKLATEITGQGSDLVLLHGWGMNAAVWTSLVIPLKKQFRITVIELPGHGASEYDEEKSGFEDWVEACLAAAPQKAIWIGWSLGGQLAQRAAMIEPDRIERLVLLASSPRFTQDIGWPHAMEMPVLKLFAKSLVKNPSQTLERFLSLQVQGDDGARETLRTLRQEIAERPEANALALEHGLNMLLTVDLRSQLANISCPMLWLLGERDTLTPFRVGSDIAALVPAARIKSLSGAAHAPFLSHPEECMNALSDFLGVPNG